MKTNRQAQTNVSRRTFLKTVAGMAAVWSTKILGVPFAWGAEAPDVSVSSNFGRMFHLPPFAPATNKVRKALLELGEVGGIMDAKDDLSVDPVDLITQPALNNNNAKSATHTAGVISLANFSITT